MAARTPKCWVAIVDLVALGSRMKPTRLIETHDAGLRRRIEYAVMDRGSVRHYLRASSFVIPPDDPDASELIYCVVKNFRQMNFVSKRRYIIGCAKFAARKSQMKSRPALKHCSIFSNLFHEDLSPPYIPPS